MKKRKHVLSYCLLGALLLTRCQEDPTFVEYRSQGYMKGTITGTFYDDVTGFSNSFHYTQYNPGDFADLSFYWINPDGSLVVRVRRKDYTTGGLFNLRFELENSEATEPGQFVYTFSYRGKLHEETFDFNASDPNNQMDLTNFTFDLATGHLKTDYIIQGTGNSTGNEATISGSIDAMVRERIR